MQDSIFTKIIKGEIPSHKIYEDNNTFAFLDIHPVLPGHCLVVPKVQTEFVWDLDDKNYQALMAASKTIARHLREVTGQKYVSQRVVGVDVPHAHVHLIPFTDAKDLDNKPDMGSEPNHEELASMADKLKIS